jgi:hypothetical protein
MFHGSWGPWVVILYEAALWKNYLRIHVAFDQK